MGGAWSSDPWDRYVYRWYTELGWTEYVSDGLRQYVDPPGERRVAVPAGHVAAFAAASTSPAYADPVTTRLATVPSAPPPSAAPTSTWAPTAATGGDPIVATFAATAPAVAVGADDATVAALARALAGSPADATPVTPVTATSPAPAAATAAPTSAAAPPRTDGTTKGTTKGKDKRRAGNSSDAPRSERMRWVWTGAGMVASFTLGALLFGGEDGPDAAAVDTVATTAITVAETVAPTVPLTVASTLPPTLPETIPPTTTTPPDPYQVARNDRQIDDLEWALLTGNFRAQFGFEPPTREFATALGAQACDAAAVSATAADFEAALQPLIDASGLSFAQATVSMGAFGGLMCVDEFIRFLPAPAGG